MGFGRRGLLFSGHANNGAKAGFSYANSNNTPSNANTNIGSRQCFLLKWCGIHANGPESRKRT
jgi:hypothetical protein